MTAPETPLFRNVLTAIALLLALTACGDQEPQVEGFEPTLRRLTEQKYRNVIADLFGDHINVAGNFDPILR